VALERLEAITKKTCRAFLLTAIFGAVFPSVSQAVELASHQAAYRLSLAEKKGNAQIVDLNGILTVRLERSCDGWILAQKMSQQFDSPTLGIGGSDSSSAIMETFDGKKYRFNTRQKNGDVVLDIRGVVKKGRNGEMVLRYTKPIVKSKELHRDTVFPIEHTRQLIALAMAGKKQAAYRVFDGFDGASGHFVTAVIGARDNNKKGSNLISPLLKGTQWNMGLAYFPLEGKASAPVMEMTAILLENGIAESIIYKYERFSILAELEKIERVENPVCE